MPRRENRSSTACYLCDSEGETKDHIPARGFFLGVPSNIITVPACRACNNSLAKDEEYFRTIVVAQCYEKSAAAKRLWTGTVTRSLWRRGYQGLRRRLIGRLTSLELWNEQESQRVTYPGLKVEGGRAGRVIRKIMKALYFAEKGQKLPEADLIIFRDGDVSADPAMITNGWNETDMGEEFRYRSHFSERGGGIWIEFYRSHWWLALIGEDAQRYKATNKAGD